MRELVRTNNAVLITAIEALLKAAAIHHLVLDQHMSVLEGSLGILPRRILVDEEDWQTARGLLEDAGLAHELRPDKSPPNAELTDDAVLGDAGEALGDSLYEARLFIRGSVKSLGADCIEKDMKPKHLKLLAELLEKAGADARPEEFKRYGSARKLYNFNIDNADAY